MVPTNSGPAFGRITSATRVIALKIPNTDAATNPWPSYVTSASQIEVDTGFTFFTSLPPNVANVLRNKVDGQTSPPPVVFAFSPMTGATGTNVIIHGTNFNAATAVAFDGVSASFIVNSNSQITAVVPGVDNTGLISVTTPGGTAISTNNFVVIGAGTEYTGTLIGWDVSVLTGGSGNYGPSPLPPSVIAPNLTVVGLTRGSGISTSGTAATNAWGGLNFTNATAALAIASNKVVTFSVQADAGYEVSFTAVSRFDYRRSPTGPTNGVLQYQIGAGAFSDITNLNYAVITSGGGSIGAIDLSSFAALQHIGAGTNVAFRIVNYLGTSSIGSWYVSEVMGTSAPDLALQGTVTQVLTTNAPASVPSFALVSFTNGQFQFTVSGTPGSNYVVQAATTLNPANWIPIYTNVAPFQFAETVNSATVLSLSGAAMMARLVETQV